MRTFNEIYKASLDVAGTAVLTSDAIDLAHLAGYSVHGKWTKTGVGVLGGTFKTFKSNDGINYIEIGSDAIGNASGNKELEVTDVFYRWLKIVATLSGGTADLYIAVNSKGV